MGKMQKWDRWGRMQVWGMPRWMFGACVATTGILGTHPAWAGPAWRRVGRCAVSYPWAGGHAGPLTTAHVRPHQ